MDKPWLLALHASQILYFPTHSCPQCGARPVPFAGGSLYEPFRNLFGAGMEYDQCFGYLRFACSCHLNMSSETDPRLAGSLRVARLGNALLPISFESIYSAAFVKWGMRAAEVNNARVCQAVQFLADHADQPVQTYTNALKTTTLGVVPVWQLAQVPTEVEVM